jgi:hypothetical protein
MDSYLNYSVDHFINSKCTNLYTTDTLNKHTSSLNSQQYDTYKSKNLIILHQNIRGLTYKIDEFLLSLSTINPQALCLSEHHLHHNEINNIYLNHYILGPQFCRQQFKQGDVSIFVSKKIQFQAVDLNQYVKGKDLEICALQLPNIKDKPPYNLFIQICIR